MKKITALGLSTVAYLSFAFPAFAITQTVQTCPIAGTPFAPLCDLSLAANVIPNIINIAFVLATLIALAFLIFGGIKWMLSGGDKTKLEGARGTIVAALVGLVIVFLSYFILNIIFSLFGLDWAKSFSVDTLNIFNN
jgi:hypothetical protein